MSSLLGQGEVLWKAPHGKAGANELRLFCAFDYQSVPRDGEIKPDVDSSDIGELFLGYRTPAKGGLRGAFSKLVGDKWKLFRLSSVLWLRGGHDSPVFQRCREKGVPLAGPELCFTLALPDRTIDIICNDGRQAHAWVHGLTDLVAAAKAWKSGSVLGGTAQPRPTAPPMSGDLSSVAAMAMGTAARGLPAAGQVLTPAASAAAGAPLQRHERVESSTASTVMEHSRGGSSASAATTTTAPPLIGSVGMQASRHTQAQAHHLQGYSSGTMAAAQGLVGLDAESKEDSAAFEEVGVTAYSGASSGVGKGTGGGWDEGDRQAYWREAVLQAVRHGQVEEVALAFQEGADINATDISTGDNALTLAARLGYPALVRLCLESGVSMDPCGDTQPNALEIAIECGHTACVAEILSFAGRYSDDLSYILLHVPLSDAVSSSLACIGGTPLHRACARGYADIVQMIMQASTEIAFRCLTVRNGAGRTPLHCACAGLPEGTHSHSHALTRPALAKGGETGAEMEPCRTVQTLLGCGADSMLELADGQGDTALHLAVRSCLSVTGSVGRGQQGGGRLTDSWTDTVRTLLETMANPLMMNHVSGVSPLESCRASSLSSPSSSAVVALLEEYAATEARTEEYSQPWGGGHALVRQAEEAGQGSGGGLTRADSSYGDFGQGSSNAAGGTTVGGQRYGYSDTGSSATGGIRARARTDSTASYTSSSWAMGGMQGGGGASSDATGTGTERGADCYAEGPAAQSTALLYLHPWMQGLDPSSGWPYWYNVESGESSWETPLALTQLLERMQGGGPQLPSPAAARDVPVQTPVKSSTSFSSSAPAPARVAVGAGGVVVPLGVTTAVASSSDPDPGASSAGGSSTAAAEGGAHPEGAGGGGSGGRLLSPRPTQPPPRLLSPTAVVHASVRASLMQEGKEGDRAAEPRASLNAALAARLSVPTAAAAAATPASLSLASAPAPAPAMDPRAALNAALAARVGGKPAAAQEATLPPPSTARVPPAESVEPPPQAERGERAGAVGQVRAMLARSVQEDGGAQAASGSTGAGGPCVPAAAAKYGKMLRMGVPLAPTLHKMRMEGSVQAATIAALEQAAEAWMKAGQPMSKLPIEGEDSGGEGAAAGSAAVPAAAGAAAAGGAGTGGPLIPAAAAKYGKMLKMGIPLAPTVHKMKMEGVAPDVVRAFEAAVEGWMKTGHGGLGKIPIEGEEGAVAAAPATDAPAPAAESPPDPRLDKYSKMKKMGVPLGAIKGKMTGDGLSEEEQKAFLQVLAGGQAAQLAALGLAGGPASPPKKGDAGVGPVGSPPPPPPPAEGGEEGEGGGPPAGFAAAQAAARRRLNISGRGGLAGGSGPAVADGAAVGKVLKRVPTMKLHWDPLKLDEAAYRKSMWARAEGTEGKDGDGGDAALGSDDVDMLTALFAAKVAGGAGGGGSGGGAGAGGGGGKDGKGGAEAGAKEKEKAAAAITLLDPKRANNLNISLAQFRRIVTGQTANSIEYGIGWEALVRAVYALDTQTLPRPALEALLVLMPTSEDIQAMKGYSGDGANLMECDKFYWLLCTRVPRFQAKVAAATLQSALDASVADLRAKAGLLRTACVQAQSSTRLRSVLACVLNIGNVLNAGIESLEAQAIRLESLLKLSATKGVDKKTSLMDALVLLAEKRGGAGLLEWAADLPSVVPATFVASLAPAGSTTSAASASAASAAGGSSEKASTVPVTPAAAPAPPPPASSTSTSSSTLDACRLELPEIKADFAKLKTSLAGMTREADAEEKDCEKDTAAAASGAVYKHPVEALSRREFIASCRHFITTSYAAVAATEADIQAAEAAARELAEYFGEDPRSTPPAAVFAVLRRFASDFALAVRTLQKRRAAQAKQDASAAAASAKEGRMLESKKSSAQLLTGSPAK